ncbi:AGAP011103-PA-like protein [Anopheles sinensis]|uniref:AGAP011103-PA-like protein n=1 Tax=Anopheles sinensis TaxID=74873 RepID=A0A084W8C3_ANOSI|nr:AGAP011103-PA-like protein [Anopheles sinensis]
MKNIAREYLASSSCHGMPYVVHPKLSIVERVCWSVMVVMSLCVCIAAIVIGHQKWNEKPILVSFSPTQIPIWQIPFPAITVCPQTRVDVESFNVTDVYRRARQANHTLTEDEWRKLRVLTHVCSAVMRPKQDFYGADTGTNGSRQQPGEDEHVVQQLINMSIPTDERFMSCMWSFNYHPCKRFWARKVTENGICYSFNMLSSAELYTVDQEFREQEVNPNMGGLYKYHASNIRSTGWTMENGYTDTEDLLAYPRRTASAGFKGGVIMLVKTHEQNREYVCSGSLQGYKITIHAPDEIPRLSEYHIRVPPMQAVSIIVKPRMLTTQKSLHRFSPSKRQCYFSDERTLRFFRVYNEQNCEFECLTNYTLETCGCVTFAMPRLNSTRVCGAHEMKCYESAVMRLMELEEMNTDADQELCDCLPACTTLKYDVELSNDDLNLKALLDSIVKDESGLQGNDLMLLYVYYKDNKFIYTERVEYMSFTSELANFGGTLALLAGMSLTSFAEIVYYLAVRPVCLWSSSWYGKAKVGGNGADRTPESSPRSGAHSVLPVRPWIP